MFAVAFTCIRTQVVAIACAAAILMAAGATALASQPAHTPPRPTPFGGLAAAGQSGLTLPGDVAPVKNDTSTGSAEGGSFSVTADEEEEEEDEDFLDLDLGDLRKTSVATAFDEVVTTVNRTESTVGRSPAAVFVITQEMIRRSGARSIPEALRMAPGVHVARISSNQWSVSIRGFAGGFSNKLLVQIDGRSVYNIGFSGVYWDSVDVLMDNIERIEVIRGPGATVWGANAVNGIINVITKRAEDTQGAYAIAGGGTEESGFAGARIGGATANGEIAWRAWGKWFERDTGLRDDVPVGDDWRQGRGGLRFDWAASDCDEVVFEASGYGGERGFTGEQPLLGSMVGSEGSQGAFVRAQWTRDYGENGSAFAHLYFDQKRHAGSLVDQQYDVLNLDLQRELRPNDRHTVVAGFRYRVSEDKLISATDPQVISFDDPSRTIELVSVFLQDEATLVDDALYFTIGSKLEYNDQTGVEAQPTARLLAILDERRVAWAAFSRAVRTPGTLERHSTTTIFIAGPTVFGGVPNPDFDSESLLAYEVGYRAQPVDWFSWDITGFFFDYEDLASATPVNASQSQNTNDAAAHIYGAEWSGRLQVASNWEVSGHYSCLETSLYGEPSNLSNPDRAAQNFAYLRSSWDLPRCWELDVIGRYSDPVQTVTSDAYLTMDVRLGWRPSRSFELAVVGQNLLDAEQLEFDSIPLYTTETQRGVYGQIIWRR